MKNFPILAEKTFTVVCLLIYTGGILTLVLSDGYSQGEAEAVEAPEYGLVRFVFLLTYVGFAALLALRYKRVLYVLQQGFHIPLLLALAFASYLWSGDPTSTFRSGVALLGTSLFGLYLASRYTLKEQLQIFGLTFGLIILLSFGFVFLLPDYGIMGGTHAGTWRGIYTHKNTLGRVMVASVMVFLLLSMTPGKARSLYILGLGCSFLLIILSTSKTALVTSVVFLLTAASYRLFRLRDVVLAPAILSTLLITGMSITLLIVNIQPLLASIGRDSTLSGRTELWAYSLQLVRQKIVLGHGYGYFWDGSDGSAFIHRAIGWLAPHSHNGLIELSIDLGLLGITIFVFGFIVNSLRSIAMVRLTQTPEGFWPLFFLTYLVSANITEANLVRPNLFYWALYVSVVYTLQAPVRYERTQNSKLVEEFSN